MDGGRRHQAEQVTRRRRGQRQNHAVVVVEELRPLAEALLAGRGQRPGQRPVDPTAPQGVDDHLLEVVAAGRAGGVLDQHPVPGRQHAGRRPLLEQQPAQRDRRLGLEQQPLAEGGEQRVPVVEPRLRPREQRAHPFGEVHGAVALVGAPERGHGGATGRRREDVVVGDALDAPPLHAKGEAVADRALPDELLVELADQVATAFHAQPEVAAVRDGAAGHVEQLRGAGAGGRGVVDPVDGDERAQRPQAGRRPASGEEVEDEVELAAAEVLVRRGGAQEREQVVEPPRLDDQHGEHHLRQDVERRSHRPRLFDLAVHGRPRQHPGLQQVAARQRVQAAAAGLAHAMTGAAEPLHGRHHRGGRADQHHLVNGADVDPQLERAGGHDRLQLPGLQPLLDHLPDLARERAVVGPGELAVRRLVDQARHLLDRAAAVGEDQGRAVGGDPLADRVGERWPVAGRVGSGHGHRQVVALGRAGVDHLDRTRRVARGRPCGQPEAADPRRHPLRRPHRGRQGDALHLAGDAGQPLDRGDQVDAALGADDGVDLVEDDRLQVGEQLAAAGRGEQDVEALWGGDQDFRRRAQHAAALLGRGVAGAHVDPHLPTGEAWLELGEGAEEVAADVVAERSQRRDVEHPHPAALPGAGEQAVERPQEGGEGLA